MTILSYGYTGIKNTCVTSLFLLSGTSIHYWVGIMYRKTALIFVGMAAANKTREESHTFLSKTQIRQCLAPPVLVDNTSEAMDEKNNLIQTNDRTFQQQ
jgi:hypothetical protein